MEPILLIAAVTYMVSGKYGKDTAQSAYKAGKEPPGLVKARLRHEAGGGRFVTRPGKDKKQPKGPGATRLLIASRWSNACEKAKTKSEDKLQRWKAWYEEQAPQRDQAWRDKQKKKINNRAERLDKWQGRWTSVKSAAAGAKDAVKTAMSSDTDAVTEQQPAADDPTEPESPTSEQSANPEPEPAGDSTTADGQNEPTGSGPGGTDQQPTTSAGGVMDYQQAASALRAAATRVEQYRTDLSEMADGLGGKNWGVEVHGDIRDMDSNLADISADYRDMANQMQQEGDNVADAEDAHPYVPGQEVVNA